MTIVQLAAIVYSLILLCIPVQLGYHFWPDWSLELGIRLDYLSPTIYLTDCLILVLFVLWFYSQIRTRKAIRVGLVPFWGYGMMSIALLVIIVSILHSGNPAVGWYKLVKLIEFIFFAFYTARTVIRKKSITRIFLIGLLGESCIAILQFFLQRSIGGMLYFLGERTFTAQTPGIANVSLTGQLLLRPYGTFPHPNVLAAYLLIGMIFLLGAAYKNRKIKFHFVVGLIASTVTLLISMSRIALIVWTGILVLFLIQRVFRTGIKPHILWMLVGIIILGVVFSPLSYRFLQVSIQSQEMLVRYKLVQQAFSMVLSNPLLGVGLGNFVLHTTPLLSVQALTAQFQPVHNIYLLVAAETGIIVFLVFLFLWYKTFRRVHGLSSSTYKHTCLLLLMGIGILGLFDHYFVTLQQGQLLFAFVFGFSWARTK